MRKVWQTACNWSSVFVRPFKQNSTPWSSKLGFWANETPLLKHTPNLMVSKATTLPTQLGQLVRVKKRWLLNKIKLTWEEETVLHCKEWWAASIFRSFWDHCPISWWNSNTLSWNVCGCCQEMGASGLFALWGIVSYQIWYQMSLSAQIGCVGVEYCFTRNLAKRLKMGSPSRPILLYSHRISFAVRSLWYC